MKAEASLPEGRRLHPMTMLQRLAVSIPALFVLLLPVLRRPDANSWLSLVTVLLYGLFVIPLLVFKYLRFRYAITPREIVIQSGVLTRQHRSIPIDRIHNIEIEQRLVPRLLGIAKVQIETAGSTRTEGVLEYVGLEEAHRIRKVIRAYQRQAAAGDLPAGAPDEAPADVPTDVPAEADAEAAREEVLFEMPLERVLLSGAFRFSLLYIVLIFTAMEYTGIDPEELVDWFTGRRLAWLSDFVAGSPLVVLAATLVVVGLLAWLTGIAINLNRFYRFRLTREDDKLHRSHGLFTLSQGTIPLQKVQAMVLRTNPIMRAFGWYALELQTMGADQDQRGHEVAIPFARLDEILPIARSLRPFELPETFTPVSRLTIRRTFFRYAGTLVAGAAAAALLVWEPAIWAAVLAPLLLLLAVLQYRYHGFAFDRDVLYVRRGFFRHYVWIVPARRFQAFHLAGSLFQRRLGLRTLNVDTAGAGTLRYPEIVDLPTDGAEALLDLLDRRFQAAYAEPAPDGASGGGVAG